MITPLSYEYIKAFSLYEQGFLPNGTAWNFESNKFIQAMQVVQNEITKLETEESEKQNGRNRTKHSPKADRQRISRP